MIGRALLVGAALVAGLELSRPGWLAGVALPRLRALLHRGTVTIESVTDDNPDTADVEEPSPGSSSSWEDWW